MQPDSYASKRFSFELTFALKNISGALVTVATLYACSTLYNVPSDDAYQALAIISGLLALILLRCDAQTEFQSSMTVGSQTMSVTGRWLVLFAILLALGYATKTSADFSRKVLFTWLLIAPIFIILVRLALDHVVALISASEGNSRKFVIAGANELGQSIAEKIQSNPMSGMKHAGFFDDRSHERLPPTSELVLGKLIELPQYVRDNEVDLIFITLPIRNVQRVSELLDRLHDTTASIYYVPDVFVFDLIQCRTSDVGGLPIIALCETPFYGIRGVLKRLSDIFLASLLLILLTPLMLVVAFAIKVTSPGSIIFRQRRYGLDGKEIVVYKFRSMTVTEDGGKIRQATKGDARVTPVGAFIRKYSIDELPQFVNVLQGRMSVVGPRPHAIAHNEEYRQLIKGYMIRHKVRPGITGLAQARGLRGETNTLDQMRLRIDSDLEYLRVWSLTLDLRIILRTIVTLFRDTKAY